MSWLVDLYDVMITGKRSKLTPLDQASVDVIYHIATDIVTKIDAALIKPVRPLVAPDWPPASPAHNKPEGRCGRGSTGQLFEVRNGQWLRVVDPETEPRRTAFGKREKR